MSNWSCGTCRDPFCDGCDEERDEPAPVKPEFPYTADAVRSYVSYLVEQMRNPMDPATYEATEAELLNWMQMLRNIEQMKQRTRIAA